MVEHMLTTVDNPYDPFDEFDAWFQHDIVKGSASASVLMSKFCLTSMSLSPFENNRAIKEGCLRVVAEDPTNFYKVVSRETNQTEFFVPVDTTKE